MKVSVAWSAEAGEARELAVDLAAGATLADALRAAGVAAGTASDVGIWGRAATLATPLREGDRVELYRPLVVDPKEARRRRAKGDGVR